MPQSMNTISFLVLPRFQMVYLCFDLYSPVIDHLVTICLPSFVNYSLLLIPLIPSLQLQLWSVFIPLSTQFHFVPKWFSFWKWKQYAIQTFLYTKFKVGIRIHVGFNTDIRCNSFSFVPHDDSNLVFCKQSKSEILFRWVVDEEWYCVVFKNTNLMRMVLTLVNGQPCKIDVTMVSTYSKCQIDS